MALAPGFPHAQRCEGNVPALVRYVDIGPLPRLSSTRLPPRLQSTRPLKPLCRLAPPGDPNVPVCPGLLDDPSSAAAVNDT